MHEISAKTIETALGRRIRQRRRLLGMTQSALAEAAGVSFQQIHKYESGASSISASRLVLIARSLRVPPAELFDGIGAAPAQAQPRAEVHAA